MAAEGSTNKGILIAVIVVAAVVWILFNKAQSTVKGVNSSVKSTYTTGTSINAAVTSLAPALGTFLSNIQKPSSAPPPTQVSNISTNPNDYSDDQIADVSEAYGVATDPLGNFF